MHTNGAVYLKVLSNPVDKPHLLLHREKPSMKCLLFCLIQLREKFPQNRHFNIRENSKDFIHNHIPIPFDRQIKLASLICEFQKNASAVLLVFDSLNETAFD